MSSFAAVPDEPDRSGADDNLAEALVTRLPAAEAPAPSEVAAAAGSSYPGRALIGWMSEQEAALTLASRRQDQADNEAFRMQARAAHAAVAARPTGVDQDGLVGPAPDSLASHIEQLAQQPASAPFFAEQWEVGMVDLSRVCALQPAVRSEQAAARVAGVDPDDVAAIAALTLPVGLSEDNIPVQFDEERRTWLISAANPNLKLAGPFGGVIQDGAPPIFGFTVAIPPSFLQVARHHGRYVLRDGYHRAFGLLQRGVTLAPALVHDFGRANLGLGAGMFGPDVYLGERPPVLADYLDDEVAADVPLPSVQKMIVIQGLELTPLS